MPSVLDAAFCHIPFFSFRRACVSKACPRGITSLRVPSWWTEHAAFAVWPAGRTSGWDSGRVLASSEMSDGRTEGTAATAAVGLNGASPSAHSRVSREIQAIRHLQPELPSAGPFLTYRERKMMLNAPPNLFLRLTLFFGLLTVMSLAFISPETLPPQTEFHGAIRYAENPNVVPAIESPYEPHEAELPEGERGPPGKRSVEWEEGAAKDVAKNDPNLLNKSKDALTLDEGSTRLAWIEAGQSLEHLLGLDLPEALRSPWDKIGGPPGRLKELLRAVKPSRGLLKHPQRGVPRVLQLLLQDLLAVARLLLLWRAEVLAGPLSAARLELLRRQLALVKQRLGEEWPIAFSSSIYIWDLPMRELYLRLVHVAAANAETAGSFLLQSQKLASENESSDGTGPPDVSEPSWSVGSHQKYELAHLLDKAGFPQAIADALNID